METTKIIFSGTTVEMLTTADIIVETAIEKKDVLIAKRPFWADPFFPKLKERIDGDFATILGVDNAKALREASAMVCGIQKNAMKELSGVKVQIEVDFEDDKARRDEILAQLGYINYFKDVQRKSQSALVGQLFQLKTNLTPELKTILVEKGTSPASLDLLVSYADEIKTKNINQELLKEGKKELTLKAVTELNAVYKQVIGICKIVRRLFKDDPLMKEQFSYSRILKQLSGSKLTNEPSKPSQPVQ